MVPTKMNQAELEPENVQDELTEEEELLMAEKLKQSLTQAVQKQEEQGQVAVLLVNAQIRMLLAKFCRNVIANLHILAFQEVPENKQITIVATIGQ